MRATTSTSLIVGLIGIVVVGLLGWACVSLPFGDALARFSYDFPFAIRADVATPELCLVTMDEKAARTLEQPLDAPWDRSLHAQLVRNLKAAGARAILFDLVFDTEGPEPAVDADFAAAMREHGQVFLGAALRIAQGRETVEEQILAPVRHLRQAARGWGLVAFRPIDPDFGVREIFVGTEEVQAVAWKMARHLGADLPEEIETPRVRRWLNYYGPAGTFPNVGLHQALNLSEVAPGFFKDRIVLVGGRMSLGGLNLQKDEFLTPHTRWGQPYAAGMEIHATSILNLLRKDWLTRAPFSVESWFVVIFSIVMVAFLSWLRPQYAVFVALGSAALIIAGACWSVWHHHVWWNWVVPAGVVTPAALVWSVGANYLVEVRRRIKMHQAFTVYFSEHVADQIALEKFSLKVGGELVDATMLFTDLEGFTDLSEDLREPKEVSDVLVDYFNNTTQHVLKNNGTVIKYAGDAIFATWGAPKADQSQADHAVQAAWDLHQFAKFNIRGHSLVTRIGVNSGRVIAGNLGSTLRFDYTLTGDAVNFASRLEGLNKYLGTQVLVSEFTLGQLKTKWAMRSVGKFRVKGKKDAVEVFELLGPSITNVVQAAMDRFAEGLQAYRSRDFATARRLFEQTIAQRKGQDGPSSFYLEDIKKHEGMELPADWNGAVDFDKK